MDTDQRLMQVNRVAQVNSPRSTVTSIVNASPVVSRAPGIATTGNVPTVHYLMTPAELASRSGCQVPILIKSPPPQSNPPPPQLITTSNSTQHTSYVMDNNKQTLKSVQVVQPVQTVLVQPVLAASSGNSNSTAIQSPQVFTHNGQVLPVISAGATIINSPVTVPVAVATTNAIKFEKQTPRQDKANQQVRQKKMISVSVLPDQNRSNQQQSQTPQLVMKSQLLVDTGAERLQKPRQQLQRDSVSVSNASPALALPGSTLLVTVNNDTPSKIRKKDDEQISSGSAVINKGVNQPIQSGRPAVTISPIPRMVAVVNNSAVTSTASTVKFTEEMKKTNVTPVKGPSKPRKPKQQQQPRPQPQSQPRQQQSPQPRRLQRDAVSISTPSSSAVSSSTPLAVTKSIKNYANLKLRKNDDEQVPAVINKSIDQQIQSRRPAITISPIPRAVCVTNNSAATSTASSSVSTEEKKLKDTTQNRPQPNPQPSPQQQIVRIQTVPTSTSSLLIVVNNSDEHWFDLSQKHELPNFLRQSGVPESDIEGCKSIISCPFLPDENQYLHASGCGDVAFCDEDEEDDIGDEEDEEGEWLIDKYTNYPPGADKGSETNNSDNGNNSDNSNSNNATTSSTSVATSTTNSLSTNAAGDQAKTNQNETPLYQEGKLAVCNYCGYSSEDFNMCSRCKSKLPPDVKSICIKNNTLDKNSLVTQQIIGRSPHHLVRKYSTESSGNGNSSSPECPRKKAKTQEKKRSRTKVEEPVCLTISSDEESGEPDNLPSRTSKIGDSSSNENRFIFNNSAVTKSAMLKEPIINDDSNSTLPLESMETDDSGENISTNPTNSEHPPNDQNQLNAVDLTESITCRTVRIGSYKVVPSDKVTFNKHGIFISVPSITDSNKTVRLKIPYTHILKVLGHYGRAMPVFFIYTSLPMAVRIREALNMTSEDGYFYNPSSKEQTQKRITLLPERLNEDFKCKFKAILSITDKEDLHEELDSKEANDILVRASPKEVQNLIKKTGIPAPVPVIQTIMVYPPPPMKGGIPINTEDYACLGEDQFLNDVIIDFYLKYLTQMMLSPEDQARTHVFSSFFYKRLTTKPSGSRRSYNPIEDNPDATPAEKRHSRVKSWTKAVNIFTKDFIIIPINENCHWFLAIICFPGLKGPVKFSDNTPITLPDSKPKKKNSNLSEGCTDKELASNVMAGKTSLMIGSTTITAVNTTLAVSAAPTKTTITLEPEEEDRDEADGEDEEWENESSEDDQDPSCDNSGKLNESQQLPLIKDSAEEEQGDNGNKGLQSSDESIKHQQTSSTRSSSAASNKSSSSSRKTVREPIKQPCILIFDSLAGAYRARVVATLRDYLRIEYKVKHGRDRDFSKDVMKGASPKVPQQTNYTDCGLYVLHYVEAFFQTPVTDYHIPIKMLEDWFTVDTVSRKRYDIQQLLHLLMAEQNVDIAALNLPELNLRPVGGLVDYPDTDPEDMEEECEEEEDDDAEEHYHHMREYLARCSNREDEEMEEEEEEEEEEEDYDNYEDELYDQDMVDGVVDEHLLEQMHCSGDHSELEDHEHPEDDLDDERNPICKELVEDPMPKVDLKSYRIPRLVRDTNKTPVRHELDDKNVLQRIE